MAYDIVRYDEFDSWQALKSELEEQFSERRPIEQLQVELVQIRQDRNETVKTFANRVERLLSDLNDACVLREGKDAAKVVRNLNATTALKSFQDGLREPLRLIVKACRFEKLKDAITKALEEEICSNVGKPSSSPGQSVSVIRCQLCSKLGHSSRNCYLLQTGQLSLNNRQPFVNRFSPTVPQKASINVRPVNVVCHYCKNMGHYLKDCRKRLYNEQKRQIANSNQVNQFKQSTSENTKLLEPTQKDAAVRAREL